MDTIRSRKKRRARPNRTNKANSCRNFKSNLATVTLQTVLHSYRFAALIKSVPFEVENGPRLGIKMFESKWRTYLWYLSNAVLYAYGLFQACSFPHVVLSQGLTTESSLHILYISMYSIGILYFGFMLRHDSTYVGLVNDIGSLLRRTEGEDWTHDKWNKAPFAVITINNFAFILAAEFAIGVIAFLVGPNQSRFAFSMLPAILQDRLEVVLLEMVLEALIILWITSILHVYYCYWCMLVLQQLIWLEDLSRAAENCGLDIKKWQRIFSFYRSLKCLNIVHNESYRYFTSGFVVIIVAIIVLFLYCTLKAFNLLPIWIYVCFPAICLFIIALVLILLPFIAKWEQKSTDFVTIAMSKLRQFRARDDEFEALYREARAMQVIVNKIGHFSTITLETVNEMILQIVDYLLLLLSL